MPNAFPVENTAFEDAVPYMLKFFKQFQNRKNYKNRKVPSLQKYQILFKHGKINLIYYRKYKLLGQVSENLKD